MTHPAAIDLHVHTRIKIGLIWTNSAPMDIALFRNEHFVGFSVPPAFLVGDNFGSHVDPRLAFVQRVVRIDAFGLAICRLEYCG